MVLLYFSWTAEELLSCEIKKDDTNYGFQFIASANKC